MASCSSWFVDGTFKAASNTLFTQIFFLLGLTEMCKTVPCLFGLLKVEVEVEGRDEKGLISAFHS
jgi:hypothetical protein